MKKYLSIIGLALLAGVIRAQDVPTNVPPPLVVVTTITNIVVASTNIIPVVQPVVLTVAQMDGVIQMVQTVGISANVPISTDNLSGVQVVRHGTNYIVTIHLH